MKAVAICSAFVLSIVTAGASAAEELQDTVPPASTTSEVESTTQTCVDLAQPAQENATTSASSESFTGYKYIGNTFSMKFHRPSCPFAHKMWSERIALIRFRRDAIEQGYAPCRYCLPPFWTNVHAVRLNVSGLSDSKTNTRCSSKTW